MHCFIHYCEPSKSAAAALAAAASATSTSATATVTPCVRQVDMDSILQPLPLHFLSAAFAAQPDPTQSAAEVTRRAMRCMQRVMADGAW